VDKLSINKTLQYKVLKVPILINVGRYLSSK